MSNLLKMEEFQLDSKGICFICLKESVGRMEVKRFYPNFFEKLAQHLKLDLQNMTNEIKSFHSDLSGMSKAVQIVVSLCLDCATVAKKFLKLNELKDGALFKKMKICIDKIYQLMSQGEKVSCRVITWKKKMNVDTSPKDVFHFRTMKNLRRTTKTACLSWSLEAVKLEEKGALVTEEPVTMPEPIPESVRETTEDQLAANVFMERLSRKRNYEEADGCCKSLRVLFDAAKIKKEKTSTKCDAMFKVPKMRVKRERRKVDLQFTDCKIEACPDSHQNTGGSLKTELLPLCDIKKESSPEPSTGSEQ